MAYLSYASYLLLLLLVIAPGSKVQDQNNGTDMTPLQKHVSFFDRDNDGVIYLTETFQGFRAIGCSVALSTVSTSIIHAFLSPKTNNVCSHSSRSYPHNTPLFHYNSVWHFMNVVTVCEHRLPCLQTLGSQTEAKVARVTGAIWR